MPDDYDPNALARFARGAVSHAFEGGPRPGTPPDTAKYGGGDEDLGGRPGSPGWFGSSGDTEPAEADDDQDSDELEAVGDDDQDDGSDDMAEEVWASLSPDDQAAIDAGDLGLWEQRVREAYPDEAFEGDDEVPELQPVESARDQVMALLESEGLFYPSGEPVDMEELLAELVSMPAAEWTAWAAEAGWEGPRPGIDDLPADLVLQITSDRLDARRDAIERGEAPYL